MVKDKIKELTSGKYIKVAEASKVFGIKKGTLIRLLNSHKVDYIKVDHHNRQAGFMFLVDKNSLKKYLSTKGILGEIQEEVEEVVEDNTISIKEAAARLKVSTASVNNYCIQGILEKTSTSRIVDFDTVDKLKEIYKYRSKAYAPVTTAESAPRLTFWQGIKKILFG